METEWNELVAVAQSGGADPDQLAILWAAQRIAKLEAAATKVVEARKKLGEVDPHSNLYAVAAVEDMRAHSNLASLIAPPAPGEGEPCKS